MYSLYSHALTVLLLGKVFFVPNFILITIKYFSVLHIPCVHSLTVHIHVLDFPYLHLQFPTAGTAAQVSSPGYLSLYSCKHTQIQNTLQMKPNIIIVTRYF